MLVKVDEYNGDRDDGGRLGVVDGTLEGGFGGKTEEVGGGVGGKMGTEDAEEGLSIDGGVGGVAESFFVLGLTELVCIVTVPVTSEVGVTIEENNVVQKLLTF